MKYIVFADFDGTISTEDVGYNLLTHFSTVDNSDLSELWMTRQIGARECLKIEAERFRATHSEAIEFIDKFEMDPVFPSFVEYLRNRDIPLVILSDGFDLYIKRFLKNHSLDEIELVTNNGRIIGNQLEVDFPHSGGCSKCGVCKAERIREIVKREKFEGEIVFAGDGFSDICAIDEANILFAKNDLLKYCQDENIPHLPFDSFDDIGRALFDDWRPASGRFKIID